MDNQGVDYDEEGGGSERRESKTPMYAARPEDSAPVARRTFLCWLGILMTVCATELIVIILCLNGTIPVVNDRFYIRPPEVSDMDSYAVVDQTALQCRSDQAMTIKQLEFAPHPLVLPNREFALKYSMMLYADMPKDVQLHVMVQYLNPPWVRLPCVGNQGSCVYPPGEETCKMIGQIFGKDSCEDLTSGEHTGETSKMMVDMKGPLGWVKPGNYFVHAKITFRQEPFGCIAMSFRVNGKP